MVASALDWRLEDFRFGISGLSWVIGTVESKLGRFEVLIVPVLRILPRFGLLGLRLFSWDLGRGECLHTAHGLWSVFHAVVRDFAAKLSKIALWSCRCESVSERSISMSCAHTSGIAAFGHLPFTHLHSCCFGTLWFESFEH